MIVKIKKMTLLNFKGIENIEILLTNTTRIYGDNATGKTTLADAFTWLIFGKDSQDKKDFNIKTLDRKNQVKHKLDHEVTGVLDVDGVETVLRRVYREKWTTRRGSADAELSGHETLFFWNDVPLQAGEYQAKIDNIISESIFKLLTSPYYFNSLKWQEKRSILMDVAGNISDDEITSQRKEFKRLAETIGNKTLDEYRKELAARKRKLRAELEQIPARIDELARNTPEVKDWELIERTIAEINSRVADINDQIVDQSKQYHAIYDEKQERLRIINDLKTRISNYEYEGRIKFNDQLNQKSSAIAGIDRKIETLKREQENRQAEIIMLRKKIAQYLEEQQGYRVEWMAVNSEIAPQLDGNEKNCPTCGQSLTEDAISNKISDMVARFNTDKSRRLTAISEKGKAIKPLVEQLEEQINSLVSAEPDVTEESLIEERKIWEKKETFTVQRILADNVNYQEALKKLAEIEGTPEPVVVSPDTTQLKLKKTTLVSRLDELKKELATKDQIDQSEKRRSELLRQEKEYAQQLADIDQEEFTIQEFVKAKVDHLESKINGMFTGVQFRLFTTQINGGVVECCDTLINGVPWQDANNAAKINAGIEIINVLSDHYNQYAPIWIDNAESITAIQSTVSQKIELYVSENDKSLRIN